MSILRVVKPFPLGAVLVSAAALLGGCGEPLPGEEVKQEGGTVAAFDILPPSATMNCTKVGTNVSCSGSGANGVQPYTYQWQVVDDFGSGPTSPYWWNGGTTYSDYCQFGLYTYGTYWTKYIRFRVVDANTYVSNEVTKSFRCWSPN
ncbi:hypothetical protein HPC49_25750 [Pyxidicoccus fallax]|uniref:Ig-like domain-containing protein n=1 Tax=Pyxidicoccus fallax TaxID=394095 RepID=A0A848LSX3_9BACT|nr:hypothetical protein [Pyxidicoccus fallax]NMO20769.1 hypothetical protein [Pyxidicoccus fallax]NPC81610.1 hypothetical protein [Pyxidicoccus fallax]